MTQQLVSQCVSQVSKIEGIQTHATSSQSYNTLFTYCGASNYQIKHVQISSASVEWMQPTEQRIIWSMKILVPTNETVR